MHAWFTYIGAKVSVKAWAWLIHLHLAKKEEDSLAYFITGNEGQKQYDNNH